VIKIKVDFLLTIAMKASIVSFSSFDRTLVDGLLNKGE
jgi:hypothetical protein